MFASGAQLIPVEVRSKIVVDPGKLQLCRELLERRFSLSRLWRISPDELKRDANPSCSAKRSLALTPGVLPGP